MPWAVSASRARPARIANALRPMHGIVLEGIPSDLAKEITQSIPIPTIGIGAGPHCDGQVLVIYDLLGMNADFHPKFLKKYAELDETITRAVRTYADEVRSGVFPADANSTSVTPDDSDD